MNLDDILGWGWRREGLIHPEDLPTASSFWTSAPRSDGSRQMDLRFRNKEGKYRWFQCNALPCAPSGELSGTWWGQNVDIDEIKRELILISGRNRLLEMVAKDESLPLILEGICRLSDELSDGAITAILLVDSERARTTLGAAPNVTPDIAKCLGAELALSDEFVPEPSKLTYVSFPVLSGAHQPIAHLRVYYPASGQFSDADANVARTLIDLLRTAIERVDNLAALNSSRERFAITVEAATDGHTEWVVATDTFYSSPRMLKLCGFPADTLFEGRMDFVKKFPFHPSDRQAIVASMTEHFSGRAERLETEMRMIVLGETRWIHMIGICTRDSTGALIRWNAAITDITDRKRAQIALRESEERFTLAVTGSNQGVFDWERKTDVVFMSPRAQQLVGLDPGQTWRPHAEWNALIRPNDEDMQVRRRGMRAHLKDQTIAYDVEYRLAPSNRQPRWIRQRGVALRDRSSRVYRMAGSIEDITERKEREEHLLIMENQLRQAQRLEAMGTLAGGIAHDFNNILGAILGYGEMGLSEPALSTRLRRDLSNIMVAGERGRSLVDRILVFSRSSVGEREPVCVEYIVREALSLVTAMAPTGIAVRTRLRAGRASIFGDATQLHQLLSNLASNGIGAMAGKGGTLTVSLSTSNNARARLATVGTVRVGQYIVLKVSDEGGGISEEVMEHMFEPFYTTKEVGVGTGLGLSLVHSIVTDIDGALDVETRPGSGTIFTVFLPRSVDAAEEPATTDDQLPSGNHERILLVDDDELLLKLACENLRGLGYSTRAFTSSKAAALAFREAPGSFDMLITDERMPGLSGTDLIKDIRAERPTLPVILVSGYLGGTVIRRARDVGATEVLKKPLSRKDLALNVSRVFNAVREAQDGAKNHV